MQGDVYPDRRRQFPGPHARAEHHAVRVDVAAFRGDAGHAAARRTDGRDRQVLEDPRPGGARAPGQRVGDVHRVGVAVGRDVDAAEHVFRVQQRHPGRDLRRRDHVHLEPEHLGHRGAAAQLLEAFCGSGDGDGPAAPVARRLAGFGLEAQVELARVARKLRHVDGRAQLPHQSRRVPGGARRELPALEHGHVLEPGARQVIGDGAADHAAADHDHAGAGRRVVGALGALRAARHEVVRRAVGGWPDRRPGPRVSSPGAAGRAR